MSVAQFEPISYLESHAAQTLALLKLLALGDREIERGQHLDADEVYAELAAE